VIDFASQIISLSLSPEFIENQPIPEKKSPKESVKESHLPDRHESTGVSRVGDIFWANASCTRKEKCKMYWTFEI